MVRAHFRLDVECVNNAYSNSFCKARNTQLKVRAAAFSEGNWEHADAARNRGLPRLGGSKPPTRRSAAVSQTSRSSHPSLWSLAVLADRRQNMRCGWGFAHSRAPAEG